MGNVKQNAYHVKLKLIPMDKGYKPSFVQGIVFDDTPALAEKRAIEEFYKWSDTDGAVKIEIKIQSTVKLRKDFMFHPDAQKNASN
jgi:hypothetical protein